MGLSESCITIIKSEIVLQMKDSLFLRQNKFSCVIVAMVTCYAKKSTEFSHQWLEFSSRHPRNWTKYVNVLVLPVTQRLGKNTIENR